MKKDKNNMCPSDACRWQYKQFKSRRSYQKVIASLREGWEYPLIVALEKIVKQIVQLWDAQAEKSALKSLILSPLQASLSLV